MLYSKDLVFHAIDLRQQNRRRIFPVALRTVGPDVTLRRSIELFCDKRGSRIRFVCKNGVKGWADGRNNILDNLGQGSDIEEKVAVTHSNEALRAESKKNEIILEWFPFTFTYAYQCRGEI